MSDTAREEAAVRLDELTAIAEVSDAPEDWDAVAAAEAELRALGGEPA